MERFGSCSEMNGGIREARIQIICRFDGAKRSKISETFAYYWKILICDDFGKPRHVKKASIAELQEMVGPELIIRFRILCFYRLVDSNGVLISITKME